MIHLQVRQTSISEPLDEGKPELVALTYSQPSLSSISPIPGTYTITVTGTATGGTPTYTATYTVTIQ